MDNNSSSSSESINQTSALLLDISKIDTEIAVIANRLKELSDKKQLMQKEVQVLKGNFDLLSKKYQDAAKQLKEEEERIATENKKIVERRKQLTSVGGTKSAKLMEREVDIATRTLQTMEEKALLMMEELEKHKIAEDKINSTYSQKASEFETLKSENDTLTTELLARQADFQKRREVFLEGLEQKAKSLYTKVSSRYPAGAIAEAANGTCRACFMSVPPQIFNQVLAGQLHQCPTCSRILIIVKE